MSSNAIIHAFQYKQLCTYISEAINAFYLQDINLFKVTIERVVILTEKLGYELKYSYKVREDAISSFNLNVTKDSFNLVDFKSLDRIAYLSKQIEEKKIQLAISNGSTVPNKIEEQEYSNSKEVKKEQQQTVETINPQELNVIKVEPQKMQPEIPSKPRIKLVDGKLVKVEE